MFWNRIRSEHTVVSSVQERPLGSKDHHDATNRSKSEERPGRAVEQTGFSLESIRELLSIRIDPEHHTCQESKGIVQERLQEVEARIAELQSMQRSLQRLNDTCCGTAHSSVYCSILEALEQGASGVKSGC